MIRFRYNVNVSLHSKQHADGSRAILVTVTWKQHRVRFYLPHSVKPEQWNAKEKLAKSTAENFATINTAILNYRSRITTIFESAMLQDRVPTVAEVQKAGTAEEEQEAPSRGLSELLKEFISTQSVERGWAAITARKFVILDRELRAAGLTAIDELDAEGIQRYYKWIANGNYENAVAMKKVSILRWFLRWCRRMGYIDSDDYTLHQPHLKCPQKKVIFLDWEELQQLYYFDYGAHVSLSNTRDVFCFCAFTGLRFSDAARLRWSDIKGDTISIVTQKTSDPLVIELNKYSRGIIQRCAQRRKLMPTDKVLPVVSIQKSNEHLKDCAMLAQIDEPLRLVSYRGARREEQEVLKWEVITTHCARRTFVVNALRLGIPAEVIMKWTGHSDFKAMKPYVDIVDELKRKNMQLFDNA